MARYGLSSSLTVIFRSWNSVSWTVGPKLCSSLLRIQAYTKRSNSLSTLGRSGKGTVRALQNVGVADSLILILALIPSRVPSSSLTIRQYVSNKPSTPFFKVSKALISTQFNFMSLSYSRPTLGVIPFEQHTSSSSVFDHSSLRSPYTLPVVRCVLRLMPVSVRFTSAKFSS